MYDIDSFFFILVNIGNILSVAYNIPQIIHTWKTKKATDISLYFLWMRFVASAIWCLYSFYYKLWDVAVSWVMSLFSTILILYYKYYPGIPNMVVLQEIQDPP